MDAVKKLLVAKSIDPTLTAPLVELMREDASPAIRRTAAFALGKIRPTQKLALAALVEVVNDVDEIAGVRQGAIDSLGKLAKGSKRAAAALERAAEDFTVTSSAVQALVAIGAADKAKAFLEHPDEKVRTAAGKGSRPRRRLRAHPAARDGRSKRTRRAVPRDTAALIREERYRQLGHRVHMINIRLGIPGAVAEEVSMALPFLEDHPLKALMAARTVPAMAAAAAAGIPRSEIQLGGSAVHLGTDPTYGFNPGTAAEVAHADDVADDFLHGAARAKAEEYASYIAKFLKVSPHSPAVPLSLIRYDWAKAQDSAVAWEKEFAGQPSVLAALGQKYMDLGQHDAAERLFLAAAKLAPENRCYFALAQIYGQVRKDEVKMLAIMEERLKLPEYGLESASMRVRIAEVYGKKKDYNTALKYAEKAAEESGAEWAMRAAITWAEAAGDNAKAAMWEKRRRERYGGGIPQP